MNAELIPIREHAGRQAVSGRELHEFLQITTPYTKWFDRMLEYGFAQGVDHVDIFVRVPSDAGGRDYEQKDHALTLDMAKELSMLQRNDRGKQARRYFIEVEKRAQVAAPVALPGARELALMVIQAEDARVAAESRAVVAEEFRDAIELNDGITVRAFHKKYFSEHTETEVNTFLYSQRLIANETGRRMNKDGKRIPGKNHRHPLFRGKAFFYLASEADSSGVRHEKVRVRPGAPELELVEYMSARGFTPNRNAGSVLQLVEVGA